ncbi:unnamed protein product [Cladocopium goreaui]|uniref:Cys-loop ligand-gated ion channel (ELIC) n=1 Tax=Cladocopium goreaui TaxID=2562237 RepID=A0A9P1CUS2_9DINO|nr:unnamed protein product [Cladocopium goreaui]
MRVYYFGVRVNWDKLLAIDQQKESFKAQIFVEATLLHPQKVRECDEKDVLKFFTRATVENSLAKPKDDEFPTQDDKKNWRFVWLIHGEFGEELELQNFPFDTQDLSVMLRFGWPCKDRKEVQVRFVDSRKSKVFVNIFCLKNAWTEPKAVDVRFGFTKIDEHWKPTPEEPEIPDQFPLIWIRCQVGRKPKFYLLNVVLPVASIVFASISSLAVFEDMGGRLGATLTLLLTAVAYKYLVAEMVPRISYNTLLDWYVLICWAFLLLMVLGNCFVHHDAKTAVGFTFGALFAFFNAVFAVVCLRMHRVERQRLEISDDHGDHGEPLLGATSSDEENEALVLYYNDDFNTQDPQNLTRTLEEVKALPKETCNGGSMSPSSVSTAGSYASEWQRHRM